MAAVYLLYKYEKVHTPLEGANASLFPAFSAFCAKRGLDPAGHALYTQPKGRAPAARVDLSMSWGMLGLSTNVNLEVQALASGGGGGGEGSEAQVRVALDFEGARYTASDIASNVRQREEWLRLRRKENEKRRAEGLEALPETDASLAFFKPVADRSGREPLDTLLLSAQISSYCSSVNKFADQSFGKLFLASHLAQTQGAKGV
jgi:hypothetical protein